METNRESDRPAAPPSSSSPGGSLPRPELNPLMNPLLGKNMGRWAQVYFTAPPERREQAVEELLRQLQVEAGTNGVTGVAREPVNGTATATPSTPPAAQDPAPAFEHPEPEAVTIPQMLEAKETSAVSRSPESNVVSRGPAGPQPVASQETRAWPELVSSTSEQTHAANNNGRISTLECPSCQHKNAAEQRFCGLCGLPLDAAPKKAAQIVAAPQPSSEPRAAEREPDWEWLRQRSLSHLSSVDAPKSRWRFVAGLIALIVVMALGYVIWTHRDRADEPEEEAQQSRPETPSGTISIPQQQSSATPAPVPPAEKPEVARRESGEKGVTKESAAPARPRRVSRETPTPSAAVPKNENAPLASSGNGSEELQTARQFLDGQGVRKDSSTAAQWLWKSVAKQNNQAVLLLSDLYVSGTGVPHSCEQARILLVAAAKRGSSAAAQKLRTVERNCR